MNEMLAWLRAAIERDKAAAEALPHGPWHVELGRRGYPQRISNAEPILIAETYTGPEHAPDIAEHICRHDPRDTIARCEAELKILDRCERVIANPETYDETAEELAGEVKIGRAHV